MFPRILFLTLILGSVSACSLTNKSKLADQNLAINASEQALIFQLNEKFGSFLSSEARVRLKEAELKTLNVGKPSEAIGWTVNKDMGGRVTAYQLFRVGGALCRKFQHVVFTKGEQETGEATACRRGDDDWKLVN